jgi:ABC-2 type transport system ATP-binding protein
MISLENVTKEYGSLVAVNDVSYTVNKGEFFALLGPNGAGKTTVVRMLLGFSRPTDGTITIDGLPAGRSESRKKVGYLAELHRIPPYLSGQQYLLRHAAFCGLIGSSAKKAVGEILERVGMTGKEKQKASTYSKGMAQRIGLGAALLGDPELLVLDEPVSGLDPLGMRDVRIILEEFKNRGNTIILNSHLLSEVERLCDTVAIMNNGRIMTKGSISNVVRDNETLEDVFFRHIEG